MSVELGAAAFAFLALVCLLAGFAHGAIGFGFPIVATPLAALVIDIKSAIALLVPVTLVLVVASVLRGGGLRELLARFWFLPLAMAIGAWLGTRLLIAAPPEPFLLVLAALIVLYLNLDRLGFGASALAQRWRLPLGLGLGLAAGITEAVANVAGPLLLIYFMLLGLQPAQLVQTLNLCFTVGKGAQMATWVAAGAMTPATWLAAAVLAIPALAALLLGMRVRGRIDAATYRRWLRRALAAMAILLAGQFLFRTL
jgi:uncharacterized membrane protein YfcA